MRWTYLITRLFILLLIALALYISKDSLIRMALVRAGQSSIGAKVEIGQVRSSLRDGKLYLREVAITDPRDPMRNLLQADVAYLVVNPHRLLHRELVIESGSATQVRFGAPRSLSGSLPNRPIPEVNSPEEGNVVLQPNRQQLSKRWLEQFTFLPEGLAQGFSEDKLTTYQISHELVQKWEPLMNAQQQELTRLTELVQQLEKETQFEIANPLRDQLRVETAKRRMQTAEAQLSELYQNLSDLNLAANRDLVKLEAAKDVDLGNLEKLVGNSPFDTDLVSGHLMQQNQVAYTREVVNWFHWFRNSIPDPNRDFRPTHSAGADLKLTSGEPAPRFLVKHLDLDGEGRVAGHHFHFSGFAKNLSTQPERHDQPITFHLRAQGQTHLVIDCTLDRRQAVPRDTLVVHCPNLSLPAQTFGNPDSMLVKMTPCRMEADIRMELYGNELSGNMVFRHTDLMMQIEEMKTLSDESQMADEINLNLASLSEFEIIAQLGGTIDAPEISINSDLGPRFAAIMNRIAEKKAGRKMEDYCKRITEINHEHVDGMNQFVIKGLAKMLNDLKSHQSTASQIQTRIPKNLGGSQIRR